jgi:hypothetical protein
MALTFSVKSGYNFSASEKVTYAKLNLLGSPTIRLNGTLDTSQLADGAVTTLKLASPIDINSKISDHNLALVKLAQGTHGQILYYDSNGDLVTLAPGTSGNFLKTQGPGADPTWEAQAGIGTISVSQIQTDGASKYISTDSSGNIQWENKSDPSTIRAVAHVWDQKTTNVAAGDSDSAIDQTRELNQFNDPDNIIVSLSSNQITLDAGTYMIDAAVPGDGCNFFVSWLYDTTGSATLLNGTSCLSYTGDRLPIHSLIRGRFTIGVQSTIEIRFRCSTSQLNGLGRAANISGHPEIYTSATIYKFD